MFFRKTQPASAASWRRGADHDHPAAAIYHPYRGPLVVHEVTESEAPGRCRGAAACAFPPGHDRPCVTALPRGHPVLALMRRHEIGLCNGWGSTVRVPLK